MPVAARKLFCAALGIIICAATVCAGTYSSSSIGTSSGKFLSFGSSARATGMGEAYSAAAQEADTIRYNPAAMTRVEANSAEVMHANYLAGTFLDSVAFVRRLGSNQAISLSALQMSYGSIAETDETGYQTGTARPVNLALAGAYAYKFSGLGGLLEGSAAGFSASYVQSTIVSSAKTFTFSIGLLSPAYGPYETQLAFIAENLMGTLKFDQKAEPLPMTFKLGGVARIQPELVLALELVGPRDNAPYAAVGVEKRFKTKSETRLAVRGGYNMRSAKDIGGLSGFATGIGISFDSIALDYALIPFGDLGYTHKLALGFKFGSGSVKKKDPAYSDYKADPESEILPFEPEPLEQAVAEIVPAPKEKTYKDYLASADNYILERDYKNALIEYGKAQKVLAENDKRRVFIFEQQGQLSIKLKNISKAKEFYLAAIQTAKKMRVSNITVVNAYLGLAHCFEKSGNIPPAIKNYEKALALSRNDKTKMRIRKILQKLKTLP